MHVNKKERKVAFILHLYRDNESGVELEAWIVAHLRSAVCDVNVCHVFTHTLSEGERSRMRGVSGAAVVARPGVEECSRGDGVEVGGQRC